MDNGDSCVVIAETHKGKAGVVKDRHVSKGGNVTMTVRQADGTWFKTLERSGRPAG
jgi:ribosomal protein S4E